MNIYTYIYNVQLVWYICLSEECCMLYFSDQWACYVNSKSDITFSYWISGSLKKKSKRNLKIFSSKKSVSSDQLRSNLVESNQKLTL